MPDTIEIRFGSMQHYDVRIGNKQVSLERIEPRCQYCHAYAQDFYRVATRVCQHCLGQFRDGDWVEVSRNGANFDVGNGIDTVYVDKGTSIPGLLAVWNVLTDNFTRIKAAHQIISGECEDCIKLAQECGLVP